MTPNIYISAPITVDWNDVLKVVYRVNSGGFSTNITFFERNSQYSPTLVNNCDIFVFMTPNNTWKFNINTLPSGVRKEYDKAVELGKTIFMAYKVTDGMYNLYYVTRQGDTIQGTPSSSAFIWKVIEKLSSEVDSRSFNTASKRNVVIDFEQLTSVKPATPSECVDYDSRLLL